MSTVCHVHQTIATIGEVNVDHVPASRRYTSVGRFVSVPSRPSSRGTIRQTFTRRIDDDDGRVHTVLFPLREYVFRCATGVRHILNRIDARVLFRIVIAFGTTSTPYTWAAFRARNRLIVPMPQYSVDDLLRPRQLRVFEALPYNFSVWTGSLEDNECGNRERQSPILSSIVSRPYKLVRRPQDDVRLIGIDVLHDRRHVR